jgi:hypothetical protein
MEDYDMLYPTCVYNKGRRGVYVGLSQKDLYIQVASDNQLGHQFMEIVYPVKCDSIIIVYSIISV